MNKMLRRLETIHSFKLYLLNANNILGFFFECLDYICDKVHQNPHIEPHQKTAEIKHILNSIFDF